MNNFFKRLLTTLCLAALMGGLSLLPAYALATFWGIVSLFVLFVEWPQFGKWWLTPVYPVIPLAAMTYFAYWYKTESLMVLLMVASYDTGAYVAGSLFGRHALALRISPGKTWEGLMGGIIWSVACSWCIAWYIQTPLFLGILPFTVLGFLCGFIAFWGDLLESWLKRQASLKDSGIVLPGHGGVLDRIDGFMIVSISILAMNYIYLFLSEGFMKNMVLVLAVLGLSGDLLQSRSYTEPVPQPIPLRRVPGGYLPILDEEVEPVDVESVDQLPTTAPAPSEVVSDDVYHQYLAPGIDEQCGR